MSFRISVISKVEMIERKFAVVSKIRAFTNANVSTGELTPVITAKLPKNLQFFELGWDSNHALEKFRIPYVCSEGHLNPENNQFYSGSMGIITHPDYREAIKSNRCVVVADAILVWNKLNAFLVYPKNKKRPFVMAGIWREFLDPISGRIRKSVAIITTVANEVFQELGQQRAPLILNNFKLRVWMNSRHLTDVVHCMKPFDSNQFNAYPIDASITNPVNKSLDLLQPIGPRLYEESQYVSSRLKSHVSERRWGRRFRSKS